MSRINKTHGIRSTLSQIDTLFEMRYFRGSYNTSIELLDLAKAIETADLAELQRDSIRLVYIDGYTQGETASKLGITQPVVSRALNDGIRKIEEVYDEWALLDDLDEVEGVDV